MRDSVFDDTDCDYKYEAAAAVEEVGRDSFKKRNALLFNES